MKIKVMTLTTPRLLFLILVVVSILAHILSLIIHSQALFASIGWNGMASIGWNG